MVTNAHTINCISDYQFSDFDADILTINQSINNFINNEFDIKCHIVPSYSIEKKLLKLLLDLKILDWVVVLYKQH